VSEEIDLMQSYVVSEGQGITRDRAKDWKLKRVVVVVHPDNTPPCPQALILPSDMVTPVL
jgi:hypothetical protein